jgi:hypothetical protein
MSYKRDTELRKRGRKFRWQNKGEEKGSPQEGLYASTLFFFFLFIRQFERERESLCGLWGDKNGIGIELLHCNEVVMGQEREDGMDVTAHIHLHCII